MIFDGSSNASWRRRDMDMAKRAIRKSKEIMHHVLLRGYGTDAQRRSFLAQAMCEFALADRDIPHRPRVRKIHSDKATI